MNEVIVPLNITMQTSHDACVLAYGAVFGVWVFIKLAIALVIVGWLYNISAATLAMFGRKIAEKIKETLERKN